MDIDGHIKTLRRLARELKHDAGLQYDCCHGSEAEEALEGAAKQIIGVADELESAALDELRAELRK